MSLQQPQQIPGYLWTLPTASIVVLPLVHWPICSSESVLRLIHSGKPQKGSSPQKTRYVRFSLWTVQLQHKQNHAEAVFTYSLLCNSKCHLLLSFSSREVQNKKAVLQVFWGLGCFCCRLLIQKTHSFTLNTKCWTSLGGHPFFSKLLHHQAGLENLCE